jgi:hypothetical protein
MTQTDIALQTYHTRYKNTTYRAIQTVLIQHLEVDLLASGQTTLEYLLEHSQHPSFIRVMNLVTDAALEIVGHPLMAGRGVTLIHELKTYHLLPTLIEPIADHLTHFDARAADNWAFTAQTVGHLGEIMHFLLASTVH